MDEKERIREKRKTILSIISVSCSFGIIFGIIAFFVICNPLEISATDLSQFKQNTLRDSFTIVTFWVLIPEGLIILLIGYKWGKLNEKKLWFNRLDQQARDIINEQKQQIKLLKDKDVQINDKILKLKSIIRKQAEMIQISRNANAGKINYEDIIE